MPRQNSIKAAVLNQYGTPRYADFPAPTPDADGTTVVRVAAAAVNGVDHAIASGRHFLSPTALPVIAGRDGVGTTEDGRQVYFDGPRAPYGSMAEQVLVTPDSMIEIPEGADLAVAAVLGNAGLAAWLPLSWRAGLRAGETVAILGAGGVVGSLAVQVARHLGAGTVIGVDRGAESMRRVRRLGADAAIDTTDSQDLAAQLRAVAPDGIDVIVDYLWSSIASATLDNAAMGARLVQVGALAGDDLSLSGQTLRSRNIDVLGFVSAFAPLATRAQVYRNLVTMAIEGRLEVGVHTYPLEAVEAAWNHRSNGQVTRPVLIPSAAA